jgi:NADH-quinone oxidoreductase subunit C
VTSPSSSSARGKKGHGDTPGHLVRLVRNRLGAHIVDAGVSSPWGDRFLVRRERLVELIEFLRGDPDADLSLLVDITGVDWGAEASPRFEVRYQLRSPRLGYRAHVVTHAADDDPTVPSLTSLYTAADALERELHEMLGICPDGHPQLRSLLLYPGFVGHPLRKDYRAKKEQPLVALLGDDVPAPTIIDDEEAKP